MQKKKTEPKKLVKYNHWVFLKKKQKTYMLKKF